VADVTFQLITDLIAPLRVAPGSRVTLSRDFDPAHKAHCLKKKDGAEPLQQGIELLAEY